MINLHEVQIKPLQKQTKSSVQIYRRSEQNLSLTFSVACIEFKDFNNNNLTTDLS